MISGFPRASCRVRSTPAISSALGRLCQVATRRRKGGESCRARRTQTASLRSAQGSRILSESIAIDRRQRLAAASGTTAMPTPASTIRQIASKPLTPQAQPQDRAQATSVARQVILRRALAGKSTVALLMPLIGMRIGQALRLRLKPATFRHWFFSGLCAWGLGICLQALH